MAADGAVVVVMSDGAYGSDEADDALFHYQGQRHAGREEPREDPHADIAAMGRILPRSERGSAQRAVASIMNRARGHGLHDNTTIAAARMPGSR